MRPGRIDVHIEELVLHEFRQLDGDVLGDAFRGELVRLLAQGTAHDFGLRSTIAGVEGRALTFTADSTSEKIGIQLAHAVHGGLTAMMGVRSPIRPAGNEGSPAEVSSA